MFVVLGASGNTGKVVAETLLTHKRKVRVVLRDAAKGQAWREAGADVSIADVEDGAALGRAFSGAEGAYVLFPPNLSSSQVRVDNNRRASAIAAAVEAADVPHVVARPHGLAVSNARPFHENLKVRIRSYEPGEGWSWCCFDGLFMEPAPLAL